MKTETAYKLARKHGVLTSVATRTGYSYCTLKMPQGHTVEFVVHDTTGMDQHVVVTHRHPLGGKQSFKTLSGAICAAKYRAWVMGHKGRRVIIREMYHGFHVVRTVRVEIDGLEVLGRRAWLAALADTALQTGFVEPLIDQVEEHLVGRDHDFIRLAA